MARYFNVDPTLVRVIFIVLALIGLGGVILYLLLRVIIPPELQAIVPDLPSVPVRLLVQKGAREYAMIGHFKRYPWVIDTYQYEDTPQLLASLTEQVIVPAEKKVEELREEK